jgi:hypothetical protein
VKSAYQLARFHLGKAEIEDRLYELGGLSKDVNFFSEMRLDLQVLYPLRISFSRALDSTIAGALENVLTHDVCARLTPGRECGS